jgi:hypothetical protein
MTKRSQKWFHDAVQSGMDTVTAYMGTEVIDSWENFWKHSISDENLLGMKNFGLQFREAALHRWSIQAGPRPWLPSDETKKKLKDDPRWSTLEDIEEQLRNKPSTQ